MVQIVSPHGGTLVQRVIKEIKEIANLLRASLCHIEIPETVLVEVENIAHGCFSPLDGFPNRKEVESILAHWKLSNGTTFPIPPLFPIDEKERATIETESRIILTYQNQPVGIMEVEEIFPFDKSQFLQAVFKTADTRHPGVAHISRIGNYLVSGKVSLFEKESVSFKGKLTPRQARELFSQKGWKTITAFSTTNIPHRAHEYLQRCALEFTDGLFIHALEIVSADGKTAKYPPQMITAAYKQLIDNYLPEQKILFSSLPMVVRCAGPRSSVLQAIVRQNFGCTYHIFGRDHEGFSDFYEKYESQEIFTRFTDLLIRPLCFKEPFYCPRCEQMSSENSCRHSERGVRISGTDIRTKFSRQEPIEHFILRPEVKSILQSEWQEP